MAETTYDRTKPQKRFTAAVSRGLRESAVIAIGVIALVMLVALASYHRDDPAFSSTGGGPASTDDGGVGNRIGPFGAWLSDILFFLFGRPAYLFPLMLGVACFVMFRHQDSEEGRTRANSAVRIGGFTLLLIASCGLATLHWSPGTLRESAGGVVGQFVGTWLADNMNFLGATLFMLAAWMAGVSLAFGVSWITIVDRIGAGIWDGIGWIRARRSVARDVAAGVEAKKARFEAAKVEEKKAAARVRPRIEAPPVAVEKSDRVEKERQVPLFDAPKSGELPPLQLLDDPAARESGYSQEALEAMSRLVELKLKDFGVEVEVVAVLPGPVVTRFEMRPAPGVKVSQISSLAKDLARSLSAISVRVVEVIPGKSVMGLEIPNEKREIVTLGEIIKSKAYDEVSSPLALALGKDIGGAPVCADLAKMPHLLIAGTTGSGKSVAINAMVLSLLYKSTAEHVRLIMIDPKMLELSVYEGIPHLLAPVVTDMKHAANALRWCVAEMERRYALMSALGVRNISGFNRKVKDANDTGRPIRDPVMTAAAANDPSIDQRLITDLTPLPYIVVIIDELADLMMIVGKKVEELIARLAQKARASWYPPGARHAASVGGRHHRPHQGQYSLSHRVPGVGAGRFAHHPRPDGCGIAARPRRHALSTVRHLDTDARTRRVRRGCRSASRGGVAQEIRRAELHRRRTRRAEYAARRNLGRAAGSGGRRPGRRTGRAVRRGRQDRYHRTQAVDFLRAAASQDRLQPRGASAREHGVGRRRGSAAAEWCARNSRACAVRR